MNQQLEKRLLEVEKAIKAKSASRVWVDMFDNALRIDVNGKRGDALTFPTTYEAARWLENRVMSAENVTGIISVENITDLFGDEQLEAKFSELMKGDTIPLVMNLAKWDRSPLQKTALSTGLKMCFSAAGFHQRYKTDSTNETDGAKTAALFLLYSRLYPGSLEERRIGFTAMLHAICRLPA